MNNDANNKIDLSALRIERKDFERSGGGRYIRTALWIIIPATVIILALLVLGRMTAVTEVKIGVSTTLTATQAQSVLSATGYVVAQRQAAVASKATGRLEYLEVEEGDRVARGQVIGRLENTDMSAALELAKANLEQARAESTQGSLNFNRIKELLSAGSATAAEFEIAQARYHGVIAAVKAAEASVSSATVALENTYIRAPFDGTVLTKYADVGEVVAPFASSASSKGAVVDLADMGSLEVEADVSEANIQRVSPEQPCEIILDAYPDIHYKGAVKKIVPTADRTRATVMTKIAFSEIDARVLPEMSARINFLSNDSLSAPTDSVPTVAVPGAALVTRGDRLVIFTVVDDRAREVSVTAGKKVGGLTQITQGLESGQRVILSPPTTLKDGDKIKVSEK